MRHFHPLFILLTLIVGSVASVSAAERISFKDAKEGEQAFSSKFWVGIVGSQEKALTSIRLDHITSVSKHTYSVSGQLVREVTIDTMGNNSIRFYCMDTNAQLASVKDRMSNTASMLDSKVGGISHYPAKSFPEGTYSHNIEYKISKLSELDKIYDSVINAVINNKGCTYRVKE